MTALDVIDVGFDDGLEFFGPEGEVRPHVVSVTPSYGTSDVSNDVALEIVFSEEAFANRYGAIVLVNEDTGQRNWINADDTRLVQIDGNTVTITPAEHLQPGASYSIVWFERAFLTADDQTFFDVGGEEASPFSFTVSDTPAPSEDSYRATAADQLLRGGADDDVIRGGQGDDFISGGIGNDLLGGGAGEDELIGGAGDDLIRGGEGDDLIFGGIGNDRLGGGAGADDMIGGEGNDTLVGADGEDFLSGGAGDDRLVGGTGGDFLSGDYGNDLLRGGAGADVLDGGAGNDTLVGGADGDRFVFHGDIYPFFDFSDDEEEWDFISGGHDVIVGFNSEEGDEIMVLVNGVYSFETLMETAEQQGRNLLFDLGESGTLTLQNTQIEDLSSSDFSFGYAS